MPEIFKATGSKKGSNQMEKILEKCPRSQWGSFIAGSDQLRFESQQEDEEVVILGRRHPITNLGWIAVVSFAIFIPIFWNEFPFIQTLNGNTLASLTLLWYLALGFYALQSFLMWFYNVYIVTNERLVDVDFVGLLNKTVNVTELGNVEDVNYSQRGIVESLFNYGDVITQTASEQKTPDATGEMSAFTFESIAYPDKVVAVISQLVEDERENNHKK
jgi:hypothetical protein